MFLPDLNLYNNHPQDDTELRSASARPGHRTTLRLPPRFARKFTLQYLPTKQGPSTIHRTRLVTPKHSHRGAMMAISHISLLLTGRFAPHYANFGPCTYTCNTGYSHSHTFTNHLSLGMLMG